MKGNADQFRLRDIHPAIPQGRMALLPGGSGAGRTTLLNEVRGCEKADAEMTLNGNEKMEEIVKAVDQKDQSERRRWGWSGGKICVKISKIQPE